MSYFCIKKINNHKSNLKIIKHEKVFVLYPFGNLRFLSIYASSDVDFTIIDLKCYNKRPADGIDQLGPRTLVSSPVVYLNNYNLIFENSRILSLCNYNVVNGYL